MAHATAFGLKCMGVRIRALAVPIFALSCSFRLAFAIVPPMLYRFASCDLDDQLYQLKRDGVPVEIEPKVFDVLLYLLHNHDRIISKEELLDKLWPGQVVGEAALTRCIVAARKAVGDDGTKQGVIETQHGRGYRFVAPLTTNPQPVQGSTFQVPSQEEASQKPVLSVVEGANGKNQKAKIENSLESSVQGLESEKQRDSPTILTPDARSQTLDTPAPSVQRSWSSRSFVFGGLVVLIGLIVTVQYLSQSSLSTQDSASSPATPQALPLPDKPSIVVLPFVNMSKDPEQEYFSDGLTEVLTGDLSRISSLFVISRNSAFTYKGKAVKVQDVGREMGVRYVLEGSVQKADQQVRITAQLIDATTGYHVWSEQYDRPLKDIFALQDEIVQKIVTTLKLQLIVQEQGYVVRKHTDNLEAYDAFLRGQESSWRLTEEANAQARQMFEKAIALDPQYAEAYVWLGVTYRMEWIFRWNTAPRTLERALALAQQALALDDSLPVAHTLLGYIYMNKQQYAQAIAEGERAIVLDPNNADSYAYQAEVLIFAGRPEEGLRLAEQAMRLNPQYPPRYIFRLGWAYRITGRYAEAIAAQKEVISRNPNLFYAHLELARSYLWQWIAQQSPAAQTLEPAVAAVQRALALHDSLHWHHIVLGWISLYQQQYDQALEEMKRGVTLAPTEAWSYAGLVVVLSCMGRTEDALEAAAQALRLKPNMVDAHLEGVGTAYGVAGRYEEARAPLQRYVSRYPNILPAHLMLAAVYSELGQAAEARAEVAEVLRLNPKFSLEVHKQRMPIKDPAVLERHIEALRKAGLK